jgi:hypothetical protein
MERVQGLLTVILGLYDSIDTRLSVYVDSLGGAYDMIKRLEGRQRRMNKRLALLGEGLLNKDGQEKGGEGEEKDENEKGEGLNQHCAHEQLCVSPIHQLAICDLTQPSGRTLVSAALDEEDTWTVRRSRSHAPCKPHQPAVHSRSDSINS